MAHIKDLQELYSDIHNSIHSNMLVVEIDIEHLEKFVIPRKQQEMRENKKGKEFKKEKLLEIKKARELIESYKEQLKTTAEILSIVEDKIKENDSK